VSILQERWQAKKLEKNTSFLDNSHTKPKTASHTLTPTTNTSVAKLWRSRQGNFLLTANVAWMCLGLEKWNKLIYQIFQTFIVGPAGL